MKLSILMPIHDKPPETVQTVLRALKGRLWDELIIVQDRTTEALGAVIKDEAKALAVAATEAGNASSIGITHIDGDDKAWATPSFAFNNGLRYISGDALVINHSDVEQDAEALEHIRGELERRPAVYFGRVLETKPEMCNGPGHAGPVLCASGRPRALTFLMALPTDAIRKIGGWSEAFMDGVCYEDDDLTARLWKESGLPFVFDDAFSGRHHSHDRSYFKRDDIERNMREMVKAHGTVTFFHDEAKAGRIVASQPREGVVIWSRKEA